MKKLYNSPEVVITTFNTTDNTNIVYVSAELSATNTYFSTCRR